jgi:ABC-2 type transport system permease protein
MSFPSVLAAEFLKLRRSKITWLSFLCYAMLAGMAWFVIWIVKNPGAARSLGLVGQKASFAATGLTPDRAGLSAFFAELGIAAGMILLSMIVIYIFGREYAEGTAKNMLGLPIPRWRFAAAKLTVAAVWYALLTAFLLALKPLVAALLGLGPAASGEFAREAGQAYAAAAVVFALQPLVAWIAVASRGYLAPFGYTIATMIVANLMAHTDWARWCPWSIVAVLGGMSGPQEGSVVLGSAAVLALTFALGMALLVLREARADNCQ